VSPSPAYSGTEYIVRDAGRRLELMPSRSGASFLVVQVTLVVTFDLDVYSDENFVDDIRALVSAAPFSYIETPDVNSFALATAGTTDFVFRVQFTGTGQLLGVGFDDVTGELTVFVANAIGADYDACRRALLQAGRALVNAIIWNGVQ
jgi:hypothetical protein